MGSLQEAITSFPRQRDGGFSSPASSLERCIETSEAFAAWCADMYDLEASVVKLEGPPIFPDAHPQWLTQEASTWEHQVVFVAGVYVDWTARQFNPQASVPAISPHPFGWAKQSLARSFEAAGPLFP